LEKKVHKSRGLCLRCYSNYRYHLEKGTEKYKTRRRRYYEEHKKHINNQTKKWCKQNPEKRKEIARNWSRKNMKEMLNKSRFGGNKYKVLERDSYTCQKCGSKKNLLVHHKDLMSYKLRGMWGMRNNEIKNLTTLCNSCHTFLHHNGIKNPKKAPTKETHSFLWKPCPEERREKIRQTLLKKHLISPMKGKKHTEEARRKMSIAKKGLLQDRDSGGRYFKKRKKEDVSPSMAC